MLALPFNVNEPNLRRHFLNQHLFDALANLEENALPRWGSMSPQHMIEHLLWVFEISRGHLDVDCHVPPSRRERIKGFLYDNRPNPRNFKNPVLTEELSALRYESLEGAKAALRQEVRRFFVYFAEQANAKHMHPLFGLLGGEEWERLHYKHSFHHLLQFGLVEEAEAGAV